MRELTVEREQVKVLRIIVRFGNSPIDIRVECRDQPRACTRTCKDVEKRKRSVLPPRESGDGCDAVVVRPCGWILSARLQIFNVQKTTTHALAENALELRRTPSHFKIVPDDDMSEAIVEEVSNGILAQEFAHVVEPSVRIEVGRKSGFAEVGRTCVVNDEIDGAKVVRGF